MSSSSIPGVTGEPAIAVPTELVGLVAEPRSTLGTTFRSVLSGAAQAVSSITGFGGSSVGISTEAQALLQEQLRVQYEMQTVSLLSNTLKSEHETQMAPIRNIRVG